MSDLDYDATAQAIEALHDAGWYGRADLTKAQIDGIVNTLADAGLLDLAQRAEAAEAAVERVRVLADDLTGEIEELRADIPPVGPSRVAHIYRTAGLSDARDRLRAALDPKADQ